jgi:hypothetical protein
MVDPQEASSDETQADIGEESVGTPSMDLDDLDDELLSEARLTELKTAFHHIINSHLFAVLHMHDGNEIKFLPIRICANSTLGWEADFVVGIPVVDDHPDGWKAIPIFFIDRITSVDADGDVIGFH